MSGINQELVNKLGSFQNQIWQTVSLTVSESANFALNFGNPLTLQTKTSDLYAEMASPKLVIQFSFASLPENSQVILLPQETFAELASAVKDEDVTSIDENLVSDVRPLLEGIVQGICVAAGNVRNDAIVASGLSVRFQIFSFPPNLQKVDEILRTNIAISSDFVNGNAIWLIDQETAEHIAGIKSAPEDEEKQGEGEKGQGSSDGLQRATATGGSGSLPEDHSLDLLMDIPLEISVELGRVSMQVREVVDLGAGSIVEIDKAAGEPVDVLVNGRPVARGEVVVIEDNFGVRITEILSPQDRLNKLSEAA
ncbi:MAG: flagellar motor switch protein FliN [Fimbriimonadaceae bacterium]